MMDAEVTVLETNSETLVSWMSLQGWISEPAATVSTLALRYDAMEIQDDWSRRWDNNSAGARTPTLIVTAADTQLPEAQLAFSRMVDLETSKPALRTLQFVPNHRMVAAPAVVLAERMTPSMTKLTESEKPSSARPITVPPSQRIAANEYATTSNVVARIEISELFVTDELESNTNAAPAPPAVCRNQNDE